MDNPASITTTFSRTRIIAHSALYLALAVLLPVGLHSLSPAGRIFLPMHVPILLAGFLVGPWCGLAVGLLAPSLSYLLTGMPPTYAVPLMSLELPMYGFIAGMAYVRLHLNIYLSLLTAMIIGRLMFGMGLVVLGLGIGMNLPYNNIGDFLKGAFLAGLPGIMIQLVFIPVIVTAVKRGRR